MSKISFTVNPVIVSLMAIMAATRFHHTGSAFALPDASLALFFAAGLWLSGRSAFFLLLAEAAVIDYFAIAQLSVSGSCISPAYAFLLPAYAAMWQAGKLARGFSQASWRNALTLLLTLAAATSLAFLLTNSSYFLLSDKITDKSWAHYFVRAANYYPAYLQTTVAYGMSFWALVQAAKALWPGKLAKATH